MIKHLQHNKQIGEIIMKIILAPSYEIAKNIKADATVEAEYGEKVVEGSIITLAHHGPRSNNPAPCNTPDVPILKEDAVILISHIDLDTLGGIYALQGRKVEDAAFWKAAEMIDVRGAHHIHELPDSIQDKLNAYYAYNESLPRVARQTEAKDVTKEVDDSYKVLETILDVYAPGHYNMIKAGEEWEQSITQAVEKCLLYENNDIRVFDTDGPFCAASYYSPRQHRTFPATITYNEKFKSITLAFEDGGKTLNAAHIVQKLWGPEAGGRSGIAGSPRNKEMTKKDLDNLVQEVSKEIRAHSFSTVTLPGEVKENSKERTKEIER